MKKIGILYHPLVDAARRKSAELEALLTARGVAVWLCSAWDTEKARAQTDGTDLLLSVGGDGTILRSAQAAISQNIPITGVNMGNLGFMTELAADEVAERLPALLDGSGWIDERAMLRAELDGMTFDALNDVVVARGEVARLVRIEVSLDGNHLTTYRADGMVAASATGSTGYALAAGGPILYPRAGEFLLVSIVPHLVSIPPLVLPERTVVELRIITSHHHQGTLSIDGHINLPLADGARITVRQSPCTTRFLRLRPPEAFYNTLEQKLRGKV